MRPIMMVNDVPQVDPQNLERQMRTENYTEFKMHALQNPFTLKFICAKSSLTGNLP
jgi:hypothetical protein